MSRAIPIADLPPEQRVLAFWRVLRDNGLPHPVTELRFDRARQWKFDFAWRRPKVALECEGGVWTQGRHTRGSGFLKDMEKYNRAVVLGWRVVRCTPDTLCAPETLAMLKTLLIK